MVEGKLKAPKVTKIENGHARGQKRKRKGAEPEGEEDKDAATLRSLHGKLYHALKETKQAAKKAKTFEIQRAVKKLKQLKKTADTSLEVTRVESELELLKHIDHDRIANTALYTKLHKDYISKNPLVAREIAASLSPPPVSPEPTSTQGKVESRLLSSKHLAVAIKAAIGSLRNVIEPPTKQAEDDGADSDDGGTQVHAEKPKAKRSVKAASGDKSGTSSDSTESDDDSDSDDDISNGPAAALDISDNDGGDGDGWESGSVASIASSSTSLPKSKRVKKAASSNEDGDDDQNDSDDENEDASRFLPSLAAGYTRGDSSASDWSGAEEDAKAVDGAVRKNRRGQRARKAIWEKKFGKNANHVKKQNEEERAATEAKALARSAKLKRGGGANANESTIPTRLDGGWAGRAAGKADKNKGKAEGKDEGKLHPSWEAKRKLKEREAAMAAAAPIRGRKIVFD